MAEVQEKYFQLWNLKCFPIEEFYYFSIRKILMKLGWIGRRWL